MTDDPALLPVDEPELAAYVAAKLCHDFVSPAGAVMSGLDLLNDPSAQDMRDDALELITASARKLVALVHYCRVAFGAADAGDRFAADELQALVSELLAGGRTTLTWDLPGGDFGKPAARVLANLAVLTAAALPTGGVAAVTVRRDGDRWIMTGVAEGARARLKPEAAVGLSGRRLTEGLAGQWIQPYWLWLTVTRSGGRLDVSVFDGRVELAAELPA